MILGTGIAQYAQCLWGPRLKVLTVDRDSSDEPQFQIDDDTDNEAIIFTIYNDVRVDDMYTDPKAGAKKRLDIHIAFNQIDNIINILEPFTNSLNIEFDEAPRLSPDPTGMEHPNGIPLGKTIPVTWIKVKLIVNFTSEGFTITSLDNAQLFIDAENYPRGSRIHFGCRALRFLDQNPESIECFSVIIKYGQLRRFVQAIKVAKQWLQ